MNALGYIFSILCVTLGLLILSGHATVNCVKPSWYNNSYSCNASVIIPSR